MKRVENKLELALSNLLNEKSLENITVAELTKEADISRRLFYVYYKDKKTFIDSIIKKHLINLKIEAEKDRIILFTISKFPRLSKINLYASEAFFNIANYVDTNRGILSALMSKNGSFLFYYKIHDLFIEEFHERINLFKGRYVRNIRAEYIDEFYVGSILGQFMVWITIKNPDSIEIFLERLGKFQITAPYEFLVPDIS
ncbi:TetR/AcrR family transcriptional regulator [Enterococcus faecium]|uniref:HTH tetR-type domain-containing protein n=1 Tax=Enterococcus faecium TaxID=1352 RepID=A0A242AMF6_ENTFC|nr:TetR/AcrR family transcriptional regulator [Enterococcus faecium]OTN82225.1 hypothetical protein A5810_003239 [Enterococcus faecium]